MNDTNLVLGGKEFSSRLIVGTGKYASMDVMKEAHEASGAQIITVALRRVSLPSGESLLDHLDTTRYTLLPNTAGCYTADEAIRTAYLAREAGLGEMLKLEVIGDTRTLFPDVEGLLEATRKLARDGFTVMPYTNDDPVIARKLEDAGDAARHRGGAAGLPRRQDRQEALRHRVLAARGRARLDELRLTLVTDRTQTRGRELVSVVGDCLAAGLPAVQVREKDLGAAELAFLCRRIRGLTRDTRALLVVNDRVDVALAVGADGVQRTSTSLTVEDI